MKNSKLLNKIKFVVNNALGNLGYQIAKTSAIHFDPIIDNDSEFISIYNQIKDFTMTSKEQCFALYMSVKYTIQANITGDFVECGVWKGGNCMLIAKTLMLMNATERRIYLYDTYEGMSEPGEVDFSIADTNDKAIKEWRAQQSDSHNEWCYSELEEVMNNMNKINYPEDRVIYIKGKVEDTIPAQSPEKIALLRLDTDWYDSTKHELSFLYPKLSVGGVLIIDDYGTWSGSKKAVDEFFTTKPILLNRIDSGNRIAIKTTN